MIGPLQSPACFLAKETPCTAAMAAMRASVSACRPRVAVGRFRDLFRVSEPTRHHRCAWNSDHRRQKHLWTLAAVATSDRPSSTFLSRQAAPWKRIWGRRLFSLSQKAHAIDDDETLAEAVRASSKKERQVCLMPAVPWLSSACFPFVDPLLE